MSAIIHSMLRLLLLGISLMSAMTLPAVGQNLIGIDVILGDVYQVSAKTGHTTYLGYSGLDRDLWHSMAKDSQGRIFAAYGDDAHSYTIYEIDQMTGQAHLKAPTDLLGLIGLAFDDQDILYATVDLTPTLAGGPCDLYTIDLGAGQTHRIGTTGVTGIHGLAFSEGILWGWDEYEGLVTLDPQTGVATDVNPGIGDPGGSAVSTLCVSDDGVLYAGFYSLFIVDKSTGALSFIDYLKPSVPFLAGMEFLPNQPAPFSLGVSGETGGPMGAFVAGATPDGNVAFFATRGGGGPTQIPYGSPCSGYSLDLNARARLIGLVGADAAGKAEIGPVQVPFYPTGALRLQALDVRSCATSNRARVVY